VLAARRAEVATPRPSLLGNLRHVAPSELERRPELLDVPRLRVPSGQSHDRNVHARPTAVADVPGGGGRGTRAQGRGGTGSGSGKISPGPRGDHAGRPLRGYAAHGLEQRLLVVGDDMLGERS